MHSQIIFLGMVPVVLSLHFTTACTVREIQKCDLSVLKIYFEILNLCTFLVRAQRIPRSINNNQQLVNK